MNMNVNPLSSNLVNLLSTQAVKLDDSDLNEISSSNFADILTESLKTAEQTDKIDKTSSIELLTGSTDDIPGLMLDMQKAELSLNLALQIRNKLIDAYNEITRMQV